MAQRLLSEAVDEFLAYRTLYFAKLTVRNDRSRLKKFLASVGNIYCHNITANHVDLHFRRNAHLGPGTLNHHRASLTRFFIYCRRESIMKPNTDPVAHIPKFKETPRDVLIVDDERYEEVLDATGNPRDRMALAFMMFTAVRTSEVALVKWRHVHMDDLYIQVWRPKTNDYGQPPISEELAAEIRRYRLWYAEQMGELPRSEWFFIPPFAPRPFVGHCELAPIRLNPEKGYAFTARTVKAALRKVGYSDEVMKGQAAHIIRRSTATALAVQGLSDDERGYDGVMDDIRTLLGHKSVTTTEKYIRKNLGEERLAKRYAGKPMFRKKTPGGAVIRLADAAGDRA